jgi:hypothetical protein
LADPVDLHAARRGGTGRAKTPDSVAAAMRDAVEFVIAQGISAGLVSGELIDDRNLTFVAVPELAGFIRGHVADLSDIMEEKE